MIDQKCGCFYGGHGKVSIIMDCSQKHLTSKVHLEMKNIMRGEKTKWARVELEK